MAPKGWGNNNNAETGAAAWAKAAGSGFLAAAIRGEVAAIREAVVTQAEEAIREAVGIPAAEDIRLVAARGDIPTTILAGVAHVR